MKNFLIFRHYFRTT